MYWTMSVVDPTGPPPVSVQMKSNDWKPEMVDKMSTTNVVGLSSGQVIWKNV